MTVDTAIKARPTTTNDDHRSSQPTTETSALCDHAWLRMQTRPPGGETASANDAQDVSKQLSDSLAIGKRTVCSWQKWLVN